MFTRIATAAMVMALGVASAQAEVFLAGVNIKGQTVKSGISDVQLVPGKTTGTFTVPAAGVYILSFSGECAVDSLGGLMHLGFVVDNVAVAPPLPQLTFCASDATEALDGWAAHGVQVPVQLKAGSHTLKVRVQVNGASSAWIDDFSTIVHD